MALTAVEPSTSPIGCVPPPFSVPVSEPQQQTLLPVRLLPLEKQGPEEAMRVAQEYMKLSALPGAGWGAEVTPTPRTDFYSHLFRLYVRAHTGVDS